MLRKDQNDLVTQSGPGTPLGNLFRRYWLPVLLTRELPEPGCEPVKVRLLSEDLLAVYDRKGKMGLIDEFCAHRGVSLWFGNQGEEGGIRCPYHGWHYSVDGTCLEVPSEPEDSAFKDRIKLNGYPLVERGGILWTYMGPPELQPPLPEWEFAMVPEKHRFISKRFQECNWLQALEGGIDSSHVSWLHRDGLQSDPLFKGAAGNEYNMKDLKPVFEVADTPDGLLVGARRIADDEHYYWRITPWVMPCFTMVPPRGDHPVHGHFWVPIDDENCWAWSFDYHATRELSAEEVAAMEDGKGIHVRYVPGTFIPEQNKSNNYLMDRQAQREGRTFSGIAGIGIQDASLQESMGPIQDRSKEHLTSTDQGIVKMRRTLMRVINELHENGTEPPAVQPSAHHIRSAALVLPRDAVFHEAAAEALRVQTGKKHASV